MSVFASIQQVLNVFNQLYAKLGPFPACSLLFLLWCQYQNWTVYLNGGAVQCKPVDNLTREQVNNRCWEQMVSDCSTRGALIRFLMVVEKVKGRAFLGDRLAELEGDGGRAFLSDLSNGLNTHTFRNLLEEFRGWKGLVLPHHPCWMCSVEGSKWLHILNGTGDSFWVGKRALFRGWLENVQEWDAAAELLHPLLAGVEIGKSRALLLSLEEVSATNDIRDLLDVLWGELATGGAAAVIEAVVDEMERTRARKDELGNNHGKPCPYVFLSYQYLEFAVALMMFHATVSSLPRISSADPEAGLQELTVRLREAEKLDKAKMREKLGEIADELPYFAVRQRAPYSLGVALASASNICTYALMWFLLFVVVFDSNELLHELSDPPRRLWSLSGGVPWNKVSFAVAGFPRFRECTLARMTATGVDKAVVSCELSLDTLNAIALSCIVCGHLFSLAFAALSLCRPFVFHLFEACFVWPGREGLVSLVLLNMSDERYWRCSQEIADKCGEYERRLLSSLQRRVGLVVSRELVYVVGHKLAHEEGRRRRDEAANSDPMHNLIELMDHILPILLSLFYGVLLHCLESNSCLGAGQPAECIMLSLGLPNLAKGAHAVVLAVFICVSHLCLLSVCRFVQSYLLQRALLKIIDGHQSRQRQEDSALAHAMDA